MCVCECVCALSCERAGDEATQARALGGRGCLEKCAIEGGTPSTSSARGGTDGRWISGCAGASEASRGECCLQNVYSSGRAGGRGTRGRLAGKGYFRIARWKTRGRRGGGGRGAATGRGEESGRRSQATHRVPSGQSREGRIIWHDREREHGGVAERGICLVWRAHRGRCRVADQKQAGGAVQEGDWPKWAAGGLWRRRSRCLQAYCIGKEPVLFFTCRVCGWRRRRRPSSFPPPLSLRAGPVHSLSLLLPRHSQFNPPRAKEAQVLCSPQARASCQVPTPYSAVSAAQQRGQAAGWRQIG